MRFEVFTRLVDQFANLQTLHLQGLGEPLLHPLFFDMVEYAVAKEIRVTTNTNLTLLNSKRAERMVTSGLDGLFISIDGATRETYENIRVYGKFDVLLENIARVVDARKRLNSSKPDLRLTLVIMRQNLAELPDLVRLANRFEIPDIFIQQLSHDFGEISFTEKYESLREYVEQETLTNETPERIEQYFSQAQALAKEFGIHIRLPPVTPRSYPAGTPGIERCTWPWSGAYISYQGYAMPCCMVATPDKVNFGNMALTSVQEVWDGPAFQSFRDNLSSETPPDICTACSIYRGIF
jgi:MoaA/NifB/PqqE/SkfB family radical SAM enzyme